MNSRAAMIGFFALLLVEAVRSLWTLAAADRTDSHAPKGLSSLCAPTCSDPPPHAREPATSDSILVQITGKGFLEVLGIEIGNGIDIGF